MNGGFLASIGSVLSGGSAVYLTIMGLLNAALVAFFFMTVFQFLSIILSKD